MKLKTKEISVPTYVTQFSCIGSACEDTCCAGWRVTIDKKTYKKYQEVEDEQLQQALDQSIKRVRKDASNANYAYIQLDSHGACPLLTSEKLCSVQTTAGESFLSSTCIQYPRLLNVAFDQMEMALTMSCPEAARLALTNPEKMTFVEMQDPKFNKYQVGKAVSTQDTNHVSHYFANLRIFAIDLLQNRDMAISDRLIVLGLAMRKVQQLIDSNQLSAIPDTLNFYAQSARSPEMQKSLAEIPEALTVQLRLLKALADRRFLTGISNQRYLDCYVELLKGLDYRDESTHAEVEENYRRAHENYYSPFMSEKEYMLEHYLLNAIIKDMFPLTKNYNVYESYVALVVPFAVIKLSLVGMAAYRKSEFRQNAVLKLIQSFSKVVDHDNKFVHDMMDVLKESGYDTMPYVAIMLKN